MNERWPVANGFLKFPRTPYLFPVEGMELRGDRVCADSEIRSFLTNEITVEEKLDGANVGISVTSDGVIRVQNRGSYIEQPSPLQFKPLWRWIAERKLELARVLGPGLVLFGEWCLAVHSVRYDRLPDWFIGFDVYDFAAQLFWSSDRRNVLLKSLEIAVVPEIGMRRRYSAEQLRDLLESTTSAFGDDLIEGLYLRSERNGWLDGRAKIVRPAFVQGIRQHWSDRVLEKNTLSRHHRPPGSSEVATVCEVPRGTVSR